MPSLSGLPSASRFHFYFLEVWEQSSKLCTEGTTLARLRTQAGLLDSFAHPISSECVTLGAHGLIGVQEALPRRGTVLFTHYQHPSNCHFGYGVTARTFRKAHCLCHCSHGPCAQRQCIFVHVTDTMHLETWYVCIHSCN